MTHRHNDPCPACGEPVPADALDGLCPACLLGSALAPPRDEAAEDEPGPAPGGESGDAVHLEPGGLAPLPD